MDGNGRWASLRGFRRSEGHRSGVERLRGIIRLTSDLGIKVLSLYAFSTENWKRSKTEVSGIFGLVVEFIRKELDELDRNGVQIRIMGDTARLPKAARDAVDGAVARTRNNTGLICLIALNYGSHAELTRAVKLIAQKVKNGELEIQAITDELVSDHLYTSGLPPLDFLIRTGGEKRLSNFMMYQAAYAELYFTDTFWPDFSDSAYLAALHTFESRGRRFGGV
jgi:undecaprenyl diphosphate synthase